MLLYTGYSNQKRIDVPVNADLETTFDAAACADEERVFTYDEPDEDFCAHLMECYEWKTTGQRDVDWADTVARYRLSHPMEYEARPTLAETTGLLTGAIDAGIKFSVAVQTLFPAGTSIEGDREIRDSFVKGKARRIKPSRYLGGPSALALWAEKPVTVRITADAARFARGAELPTSLSLDTVIGVITGHCVCVDLRQADIPSPSEELPVVGAVLHLTTMSKYLVVLYNILMEKGDRFDMVSVPLYYAVGSIEAGQRKRREVLAATPLNDPPEPGAYGWINERAWLETAPVLDKLLALFLTDGLDVREIEGARRTTFVAFEEGELERRDEQERARKAAEERQRAAEEQAAREAEARRAAEQAERERKQAECEAERSRQEAEQRERDIKNIDAIKEAAIQAEARCRAMKTRMEAMVQEQKDLTAAYNAQGAQLAKEQNMIGTMVSKTATLQHNLRLAEETARRAQEQAAAVQARADLFNTLEFPQTPLGALLLAKRAFPDRLYVHPNAEKAAREFAMGDMRETWAALRDMAVVLYPLVFGDESVDIPARFEERSTLRLALSEGPMTAKDPALMRLRKLDYDGRVVDMSAHVKGRSIEGQSPLRVHFYPDHDKKLLVIGHCGKHLPTYAYSGK